MNSTVKLINHASAKVRVDDVSIVSDPWYEGSVFHKGWKLLHELTVEETKIHLQNKVSFFKNGNNYMVIQLNGYPEMTEVCYQSLMSIML